MRIPDVPFGWTIDLAIMLFQGWVPSLAVVVYHSKQKVMISYSLLQKIEPVRKSKAENQRQLTYDRRLFVNITEGRQITFEFAKLTAETTFEFPIENCVDDRIDTAVA